jgi:hypothetical protein
MPSLHRFRSVCSCLLLLPILARPGAAQELLPGAAAPPKALAEAGGNPLGLPAADRPPVLPSLGAADPPTTRRRPLATRQEKLIYASGVALLAATDRSTLRWFDNDLFEDEAEQDLLPQKASDLASGLPLVAELVIPYLVDGRYGRQSSRLALGAALNALVVVQPLKMAFGKERPDQAIGGTRYHGPSTRYSSFPSGHTAIAFAIATVYGHRYRRWKIPVYLLATGVGIARIQAGRHYLSDVVAGAGIGVLAGRASLRGGGRLLSWRF